MNMGVALLRVLGRRVAFDGVDDGGNAAQPHPLLHRYARTTTDSMLKALLASQYSDAAAQYPAVREAIANGIVHDPVMRSGHGWTSDEGLIPWDANQETRDAFITALRRECAEQGHELPDADVDDAAIVEALRFGVRESFLFDNVFADRHTVYTAVALGWQKNIVVCYQDFYAIFPSIIGDHVITAVHRCQPEDDNDTADGAVIPKTTVDTWYEFQPVCWVQYPSDAMVPDEAFDDATIVLYCNQKWDDANLQWTPLFQTHRDSRFSAPAAREAVLESGSFLIRRRRIQLKTVDWGYADPRGFKIADKSQKLTVG